MEEFKGAEVTVIKNVDLHNLGYNLWIENNYPTSESARLQCAEATLKMVEEFPELTRVRGLASVLEPFGLPPSQTPHWWCVTSVGSIVDPTGHQYPTHIISYEEADESRGAPTGKCPNCGSLCYEGKYLCSEKCDIEYMNYLNNPEN